MRFADNSLDNRVTAVLDFNIVAFIQHRLGPFLLAGAFSQSLPIIDLGDKSRHKQKSGTFFRNFHAQFLKQTIFQFIALFRSGNQFAFQFFQFRRDKTFRIDQTLPAFKIIGHGLLLGSAQFKIIAENTVIPHFQLG